MSDISTIGLYSNLKFVTSGNAPTNAIGGLAPGQMGFGRLDSDNTLHIWANVGPGAPGAYGQGNVIDLPADTVNRILGQFDLERVLTNGDTAPLNIILNGVASYFAAEYGTNSSRLRAEDLVIDSAANQAEITSQFLRLYAKGDSGPVSGRALLIDIVQGFYDKGHRVLTGNEERVYDPGDIETMRDKLDVLSEEEVRNLVSNVFDFKGAVDTYELLPPSSSVPEAPANGDVWMTRSGPSPDSADPNGAAGMLWVWVQAPGSAGAWEKLNYIISLANYWTIGEVQDAIQAAVDLVNATIDALDARVEALEGKTGELDERIIDLRGEFEEHIEGAEAGTDGMHSNNNFSNMAVNQVAQLMLPSDAAVAAGLQNGLGNGTMVLLDNGRYGTPYIAIEEI